MTSAPSSGSDGAAGAMARSASATAFLAAMSHDLRTPLNAVIGFAEVLHEELFGDLNVRQREYVGDIISAGRQLLGLIDSLLERARVEGNHFGGGHG